MGHATSDEGRSSSPSSSADDRSFTLAADAAIEYTPQAETMTAGQGHRLASYVLPSIATTVSPPCPVANRDP